MFTTKELDLIEQSICSSIFEIEQAIDIKVEDGDGITSESSECDAETGYNRITEVVYSDEVDDLYTEIARYDRILLKLEGAREAKARLETLKKYN